MGTIYPKERKSDEVLVRKLQSLHYDGEMTGEEKKRAIRDSHSYGLREIKYKYDEE
jgi:hypothetical protein